MVNARSQKPKRKQKNSKLPLIVVVLIILIAAGSFGITYLINHSSTDTSSESTPASKEETNTQTKQEETKETEKTEAPTKEEEEENDKKPTEYEGANANSYTSLTGYISNSRIENSTLSINTIVDQAVSGSCSFVVTSPSGKVYNKTTEIELIATSGGCFVDIPLSSVESGTYKISIELSGSDKTGKITGELSI